jgi:hypothetical protein
MNNTQTSLHKVMDNWLWNINDGLLTAVCSLDVKKCFDTINHGILLQKLKMYGFTENVIKWFSSYLANRGMKVKCNRELSEVKYVNIGIPQGSVLGPTLFLLYINDINNYVGLAMCNLYADDVLIYCNGQNVTTLNERIQHSINCVKEWYDKNLLVVNAEKSSAMMITTKQKEFYLDDNIDVMFGETNLQTVPELDYLGLKIDKNLNWNQYVQCLSSALNKKVWALSRIRSFLTHDSLIQFYKSTVQPKIDYAITVWGYTSEQNIRKIQRMQNRAARPIYNQYDHVNVRGIDLVCKMKVMNVVQRRDYFMSLLMFKSIHGLAPDHLCNEVTMAIEVSDRLTRHVNEHNVVTPFVNVDLSKGAFSYQGPCVWNSLPDDLKQCTDINVFKSRAKQYFIENNSFV